MGIGFERSFRWIGAHIPIFIYTAKTRKGGVFDVPVSIRRTLFMSERLSKWEDVRKAS
jgi:hypothetical protein